jgi:hypothetical protein
MKRLGMISFAIPKVCVSDVERHFSACDNRGALASGYPGEESGVAKRSQGSLFR